MTAPADEPTAAESADPEERAAAAVYEYLRLGAVMGARDQVTLAAVDDLLPERWDDVPADKQAHYRGIAHAARTA